MAFVEFVLYYVILYVLLLITSYSSLKIVKCTIGKNVKEQFNKKQFQKMFWFTILSYLIGVIPLLLWELCDIKSYSNGIELIIASIFFLMLSIFAAPNNPFVFSGEAILYLSITVIITFLVSLVINYFTVFKELDLKKSKRFLVSLIVSAMTAPYFYFVSFYGLF